MARGREGREQVPQYGGILNKMVSFVPSETFLAHHEKAHKLAQMLIIDS